MNQSSIVKKFLKYILNQVQSIVVGVLRGFGLIDFPVPPNSSMRKTSSKSIRHYFISGIQSSIPIITSAIREKVDLNKNIRILDFGCGVGRQLLHFTRHYPNSEYYGCDIDDTSIDFLKKNYSNVDTYTSLFHPPLKYDDGFFDMIYSVSIFSHLCLEDQVKWLKELARITKKGGYCFLTTEGFAALKSLSSNFKIDELRLQSVLDSQGFLYKEYGHLEGSIKKQDTLKVTSLLVGVEGSYGNTVMSPKYIKKEWSNNDFDVIDVIEGIIDYRQDLVILNRK